MLRFTSILNVFLHLIFIPVHTVVGWEPRRHALGKALLKLLALFSAVIEGADVLFLFAAELVGRGAVGTLVHLVVQRVKQDLDQRVRIEAVHFVFALDPALFVVDLRAPLGNVVEVLRRPSKVLHAVRVVAVRPVVLFI